MSLLKMRKQRENEQKREAISKWFASFTATAVVTVTVVAIRANPPTADLLVTSVGNEIVYRATVSDPDQKITPDSLTLFITTPSFSYEEEMTLGLTLGTFTMTQPSTEYKVSVKASLGYGLETLSSSTITSNPGLSGAVAGVTLDPSIDLLNQPETLNYFIRTIYDDPYQELSSLTLYYDYVPTSYLEEDISSSSSYSSQIPANAYIPTYSYSFPITQNDQEDIIYEIPNWNYTVFLRLEGIKASDQTQVVLDEMTFTTPYHIDASFYISDLGEDYATFYIYPGEMTSISVDYTLKLYDANNELLQSIPVEFIAETVSGGEWQSSGETHTYYWADLTVKDLTGLTFYRADLFAEYVDPYTSENVNRPIRSIEFTTFPHYSYEVNHTENDLTYTFTITVNDPNFIFQDFSFNVMDTTTEYEQYLEYGNFVTQDQGAERTYTATINKPMVASYRIDIMATKAYEGTYYYGCLLFSLEG